MKLSNLLMFSLLLCSACSVKVQGKDEAPPVTPKVVDSPKEQVLALSQPGATVWNHIVITDFTKETGESLAYLFRLPEKTGGRIGLSSVSYSGCLDAESSFQLVELQGASIVSAVPMSVWTQQTANPEKSYAVLVGIAKYAKCKSLYVDFMVDQKN